MDFNTADLIYWVLTTVLLLIVGTNGVFNLVKWIKAKKYDESEYKTRCKMLAELLKAGVDVPKEFIIKVLEGRVSNDLFAETITELKIKNKKGK